MRTVPAPVRAKAVPVKWAPSMPPKPWKATQVGPVLPPTRAALAISPVRVSTAPAPMPAALPLRSSSPFSGLKRIDNNTFEGHSDKYDTGLAKLGYVATYDPIRQVFRWTREDPRLARDPKRPVFKSSAPTPNGRHMVAVPFDSEWSD